MASEREFDEQEPAYEECEEEPDQTIEVAVNEALDPRPEEEDQPRDQEETHAAADDARQDENRERETEGAG